MILFYFISPYFLTYNFIVCLLFDLKSKPFSIKVGIFVEYKVSSNLIRN